VSLGKIGYVDATDATSLATIMGFDIRNYSAKSGNKHHGADCIVTVINYAKIDNFKVMCKVSLYAKRKHDYVTLSNFLKDASEDYLLKLKYYDVVKKKASKTYKDLAAPKIKKKKPDAISVSEPYVFRPVDGPLRPESALKSIVSIAKTSRGASSSTGGGIARPADRSITPVEVEDEEQEDEDEVVMKAPAAVGKIVVSKRKRASKKAPDKKKGIHQNGRDILLLLVLVLFVNFN
jgi:hypothetical protein